MVRQGGTTGRIVHPASIAMHRSLSFRFPAAVLLALLLTSACSESSSNSMGPDDPPAMLAAEIALLDPQIDYSDTNYLIEIVQQGSATISSPVPITDPVTRVQTNEWVVQHETERMRIEGGYDTYGRIIQILDETTPLLDPLTRTVNTTRRSVSVEDYLTRFDGSGRLLEDDLLQPLSGPIIASNAQITEGLVLDADAVDELGALDVQAEPLAAAAGPDARARRVGQDRIAIVNDIGRGDGPRPEAADAQPDRGEVVRTYRRRGNRYFLERVELTAERDAANGGHLSERQTQEVRVIRYRENRRRDTARRSMRGPRSSAAETETFDWGMEPAYLCPMAGGCEPPPPSPSLPPPPPPCPSVAGGANVLFVHGIMSNGGTWDRMDDWVRCGFQTDSIARPDLPWTLGIESQRDRLRFHREKPVNQTVVIGHSNGGLVSRAYGQHAQPGAVRGVVTLDSPNRGAIIAINAKALEYLFATAFAPMNWVMVDFLYWHPFYDDDLPWSPFLYRLNNTDETFTRVGVQTYVPKRWIAWRIFRAGGANPESPSGERAVVLRAQAKYDRARHYARFWYRPWQSVPAAAQMVLMNTGDAVWNAITAPVGLTSDGFIHGPGQHYPRAQRNVVIRNGDSHVSTVRSPYVWGVLNRELRTQFGMVRR